MTLEAGRMQTLAVAREVSPNGFYLTDGEEDVLLHYSEIRGECAVGDRVEVFLFYDTEDRLAATMTRPYILLDQIGLLEVVDVNERLGCFLEIGLGRNLLLSHRKLPADKEVWPKVGDRIYVTMTLDHKGRLAAEPAGEHELSPLAMEAPSDWKNQWKEARVYYVASVGTFAVVGGEGTGFGVIGMIPPQEMIRPARIGEVLRVRVTFIREDGRINLSMKPPKEIGRNEDAEMLWEFLQGRPNGAMPYSDETPPDIIRQRFNLSKSAFKRALGKLMKEGKVEQEGSWTRMKDLSHETAKEAEKSEG